MPQTEKTATAQSPASFFLLYIELTATRVYISMTETVGLPVQGFYAAAFL